MLRGGNKDEINQRGVIIIISVYFLHKINENQKTLDAPIDGPGTANAIYVKIIG